MSVFTLDTAPTVVYQPDKAGVVKVSSSQDLLTPEKDKTKKGGEKVEKPPLSLELNLQDIQQQLDLQQRKQQQQHQQQQQQMHLEENQQYLNQQQQQSLELQKQQHMLRQPVDQQQLLQKQQFIQQQQLSQKQQLENHLSVQQLHHHQKHQLQQQLSQQMQQNVLNQQQQLLLQQQTSYPQQTSFQQVSTQQQQPSLQQQTSFQQQLSFQDFSLQQLPQEDSDDWLPEPPTDLDLHVPYLTLVNLPPPESYPPPNIVPTEAETGEKTTCSSSAFSDTSSDVSDMTTSIPSSTPVLPIVELLSDQEVNQVDLFYHSHKTDVRVSRSLANLYISVPKVKEPSTSETQNNRSKKKSAKSKKSKKTENPRISLSPSDFVKDEWKFSKTGIPVLVMDSGNHIREKSLKIILAERGTGFTLWEDQFSHLTEYNTPHSNFHTITLSTDSTRLVGFSFDDANAAAEFAEAVQSLMSNLKDDTLNSNGKRKKKREKPLYKFRAPRKVDISQPVCFVHVTKLHRPDVISSLFPAPPGAAQRTSRLGIPRALSDSSGISECSLPSEHLYTSSQHTD